MGIARHDFKKANFKEAHGISILEMKGIAEKVLILKASRLETSTHRRRARREASAFISSIYLRNKRLLDLLHTKQL